MRLVKIGQRRHDLTTLRQHAEYALQFRCRIESTKVELWNMRNGVAVVITLPIQSAVELARTIMSNSKSHSVTGGCLCGAVRYVIAGDLIVSTLCHCRSCRRATGAPSVAWAVFSTADVSFVSGERAEFESSPGRWRSFCRRCGTPLTYRRDSESETIDITTATLDSPDSIAPTREIWVEEKLSWEVINPSISQYPRSSRQNQ